MALVLCPECGEETLDRLTNCPLCDKPLAEERPQKNEATRLLVYGGLFLCGLTAATLCNTMGYTRTAISLGLVGIIGMLALILRLGRN